MAVIFERCPNVQDSVADLSAESITAWKEPDLAGRLVYELQFDTLVSRAWEQNLHFSSAVDGGSIDSAIVIISEKNLQREKSRVFAWETKKLRKENSEADSKRHTSKISEGVYWHLWNSLDFNKPKFKRVSATHK